MQKIRTLLLLLLSFLVWETKAQSSNERWTGYATPGIINDYMEEGNKLYVATDAGVFVLDKQSRAVLEHWTKQSVGLPSNRVESIRRHPATHQIFIGTYDIAAIAVQNGDGTWASIAYPEALQNSANATMTYCIEFDDENRLWVGTSQGLLRYEDENWQLFNGQNTEMIFSGVWDMDKDAQGRLLFGSNVLYRANGDELELISPLGTNGTGFGEGSIFSYSDAKVQVQPDGTIWFFTDIGSVGRYDGTEWHITDHFNNQNMPFQQLDFLAQDETGTLWANLGWYGFARYNADTEAWEYAEPVANTAFEEPASLFFTDGGALLFEKGKIEWHMPATATTETSLGNYPFEGQVWQIKPDNEGRLWGVESSDAGGRLRNLESGELVTLIYNNEPLYISDYAFTNEGNLWVLSGKRLMRQTETGWELFDASNSSLPDSYGFSNLTIDSYGRVWISVYDTGLYRYDGTNWKFFNQPQFSVHYVIDLEAGADGQVWASTWYTNAGARLCRIDGDAVTVFNPNLGSVYWSLNRLEFDAETGRIYGGGTGLGYWQNNAWHEVALPDSFDGSTQYITSLQFDGEHIFATSRTSLMIYDGETWENFTPANSPLQQKDIYASGYDMLSGRVWIAYSGIKALDVYQTEFTVTSTTPGNHPNPFNITCAPNPANELTFVEYNMTNTSAESVMARVYNLQGALLRSFEWDGSAGKHREQLDLAKLEAGTYVIEIATGKLRQSVKIIKH